MVTKAPKDLSPEEVERMLLAEDDDLSKGQMLKSEVQGEFTVAVTELRDPDTEVVYDVRTGIPSIFKVYEGNNTRLKMLEKRDVNGNRIFSMVRPDNPPDAVTPDSFCFLQPGHDTYEEAKSLGFRDCARPGPLVGIGGAEFHAQADHPDEWALWQASATNHAGHLEVGRP